MRSSVPRRGGLLARMGLEIVMAPLKNNAGFTSCSMPHITTKTRRPRRRLVGDKRRLLIVCRGGFAQSGATPSQKRLAPTGSTGASPRRSQVPALEVRGASPVTSEAFILTAAVRFTILLGSFRSDSPAAGIGRQGRCVEHVFLGPQSRPVVNSRALADASARGSRRRCSSQPVSTEVDTSAPGVQEPGPLCRQL